MVRPEKGLRERNRKIKVEGTFVVIRHLPGHDGTTLSGRNDGKDDSSDEEVGTHG